MAPRRTLAPFAALLSLSAHATLARAQNDYDDAMATAARLESAGHPREAAEALGPLGARFADDHALALRLGWLWFSAGDYDRAQAHYARALSLSGGSSIDARLGLAWTLLRRSEPAAARAAFERVLADAPQNASALEGVALARAAEPRTLRLWPSVWLGGQAYVNHPDRRFSASLTASLSAQLWDVVGVDLTWRGVAYDSLRAQGGRPPMPTGHLQQEFYLAAGITRPRYALRLHLGRLWDADNSLAPATLVGASARLSLHGALALEGSAGIFSDQTVLRAMASWDASLGEHFTLGPIASVQSAGGLGGSFGARVGWHSGAYSLSLSGRLGDETRTVSLIDALTFATTDRQRATVSVGARVPVSNGLSLAVNYDLMRLTPASSSSDATAHFITLGLVAR